ncbi:AsmA-like C-terminal region-containing protein [Jejudonia soesokkakensis]|uniref:AsmA-like C-terminal region-containing protein n=1 Tax=Jejudonia soesokkakensis TaxID=1323432 RepID=A0ABW2MZ57_9FLAO
MKKLLKILGIFLGIVLILLALSPLFFKGTIEKLVKKTIAANLDAEVSWSDFDLSLFKSFPDAALVITDFSVINRTPFAGDTLASGKSLKVDMGIMQLLKTSDEPIKVDALLFNEAFVNIKLDSLGRANYDIAIKQDAPLVDDTEGNAGFTFDLKKYEIKNSRIAYSDLSTETFLQLKNVNHEGTGDFSLAQSQLDTKTEAITSFRLGDIEYLSDNTVSLDAVIEMDLDNQKYTFLENEARVNELPLTFNGFVKVNETNNEIDLSFTTPSSDFKNFLAVIPKVYVKELDDVKTTGDFTVNGVLKGIIDEERIPTMDIAIKSSNASFKYPDLPKAVQNISMDVQLKNETGLAKDTYLNINGLTFKIDNEIFNANGSIRNFTENALVNLALKGTLNLANIEQVLPLELEQELSGVFKADVTTNFDMASVENEQYQNIKTSGTASVTNFNYTDAALKNELKVANANISFDPGNIRLNDLNATSGQTDIKASGNIQNLIPFLLSKQDLKGLFNVTSNTFNINDFMTSETASEEGSTRNRAATSEAKAVKIPDFLDATLDFSADKVIYDNITLNNAKGTMSIQNETASLRNVTSTIFGGTIALAGDLSTKETSTFDMNLDLSKIDIAETFAKSEMLKYLVPIANSLKGSFNTKINLKGNLNNDLTPQLTSLAGNALAEVITAEVDPTKAPLLSKLGEQVQFLNIDKLSLRDVDTKLTFDNGNIVVAPFDFDIKGIKVTASGSHGLDKSINYNLNMDVPAKYLGGQVSGLLAKLSASDAETMKVALPIGLTGTLTSPQISVDTKAAVTTLTQKLIERQKEELTTKGTDILQDILGGGGTKPTDTTQTQTNPTTNQQNTTQVVKDILGGLFGKTKKKTDSTKGGN